MTCQRVVHGELGEDTCLLKVSVHVLGELTEEHSEQIGKERSCEVQTLFAEVVTIIEVPPFESSKEQTMNHVAEEVRLLRLRAFGHGNVR